MDILDLKDILKNKINADVTGKYENDEEYLFALGQAVKYINSCRKESNKIISHSINTILLSKTPEELNKNFMDFYKKNFMFVRQNKKVNNLIGMLIGYKLDGDIDYNLITAGYTHSSIL